MRKVKLTIKPRNFSDEFNVLLKIQDKGEDIISGHSTLSLENGEEFSIRNILQILDVWQKIFILKQNNSEIDKHWKALQKLISNDSEWKKAQQLRLNSMRRK